VKQNDQGNLQPLGKEGIEQSEQKFLPHQAKENQFHHGSRGNGIVISNKTKKLGEMSNINVNEELSSMVHQFKEIALRVGNRNCAMTTQIAELQKKKDVLARQLEETKGQLLK
jgi:hypothetical protein